MRRVFAAIALLGVGGPIALRVMQPAGLDFVHHNSPASQKYLVETLGGGVALLD